MSKNLHCTKTVRLSNGSVVMACAVALILLTAGLNRAESGILAISAIAAGTGAILLLIRLRIGACTGSQSSGEGGSVSPGAESHLPHSDVAELLRLREEELLRVRQQAEELEAKNRELETFSYSLAHDLKNPLTSIYASAQALLEDNSRTLDDNGRFFLQTIMKSSERMEDVLDSMLLLGRISQSELQYDRINLSDNAKIILLQLKFEHPERSVETVVAEGVVVRGDPRLLRSALENLLVNAWKYTSHVQRGRIEFGAVTSPDGSTICFVRDNGVGFDMAESDDLYQPFHRLHHSREFQGTGIGLATVKRILQRHGGRIWAEGEVAHGATFFFSLPVQPPITESLAGFAGKTTMVTAESPQGSEVTLH